MSGNVLIVQSGNLSSAGNSSLSGIITESLEHEYIEEIYGSRDGVQGILNENFIDLAAESQQSIRALKTMPGAALGAYPNFIQQPKELQRILEVLQAHNIHFLFFIGDRSAQENATKIHAYAQEHEFVLQVLGIPQTIDNDLSMTDHCLGYGSAIKYIATSVREIFSDMVSSGIPNLVSIIEVMGHHTGWLAAGASLAKRKDHPEDAPHLTYLPEVSFSKEQLLNDVQAVLQSLPCCVIVVAEGIIDAEGNFVRAKSNLSIEDVTTAGGSTGDVLKAMITSELNIPVHTLKLGSTQRTAIHCSSKTDIDEAFECGRQAVALAIEGASGKMLTLLREEGSRYDVKFGLADLHNISHSEKTFPLNWLEEGGYRIHPVYSKYALPLIQGLPEIKDDNGLPLANFLKKIPVKRLLS
ncbi:MAG: diphosphate--fructose-6-phosphate 1-phosphotransferase [Puniceicoccales bacterium]|jgi:6-phosphofructokinase 1|nr:diphosphate--fructose-6-phosphate 1-phosphotransferase [Puniceicoccales bacterium]